MTAIMIAGCSGQQEDLSSKEETFGADEELPEGGSGEAESETAAAGTTAGDDTDEREEELIRLSEEGFQTDIKCAPVILSLACTTDVEQTARGDAIRAAIGAASEWTDGAFEVRFYPSGQLGGDAEILEGVQTGTLDLYTGSSTSAADLVPELSVLDIGGLYPDIESANLVFERYRDELLPYCKEAGFTLMSLYAPDFRILTSSRPVTTPADLQGLRIRTLENTYHMEFWRRLGADPVPMEFGKLYLSLSRGDLDAEENSWAVIAASRFGEVQSYAVETDHLPFVIIFLMNQERYDALDETQKLVCRQFIEFCRRYQMAAIEEDDRRLAEQCKEQFGMEISPASDEIRASYEAASEAVIEQMKEALDADFVDRYVSAAREASMK